LLIGDKTQSLVFGNMNNIVYLCINRSNHQKPTFHPLGDFLNPALALLGQGLKKDATISFQNLILKLQSFWASKGCTLLQPFDMEMGAGTFHPATFLRAIGPEPWKA
jgi:hypothetical protein